MANVTSVTFKYLPTDKGNLYFPIVFVDTVFQNGVSVPLSNRNDFSVVNPNNNVFISMGAREKVETMFTSTNGKIFISKSGYNYRFNVKLPNGTTTYLSEFGISSMNAVYVLPIYVDPNGRTAINLICQSWYITASEIASFTSNTPNQFGNMQFTESHPTQSINGSNISDNLCDTVKVLYDSLEGAPTDPYAGAGDSTTGGGGGTFDGSSDPVAVPSLPSVGATDSGFITLFAPTIAQLKALAEYMWVNPLFDVETGFKKLFSDPMDCILGLSVVPVTVPTSGAQNVNVGNLITSVTMNVASQQYIEVDCGSIDFSNQYFGSYLDFEPYTKMALFVPYSGIHSVCADDIIGKTVNLIYHIDILTGSLVAFLKCGNSVLYEFNGACASNIPVNSMNYASTIENAIRIAVNIGTTVATAGAAAPATTAAAGATTARNIATGINLAGSTAEGALSLKPNIDRAGSLGGTTGLMGNQIPYFIITRPRLCKPKNQNKYKGYPSFIECVIGDLEGKGYTEFDTVILENSYLTDSEKDELIGILKEGVFL